MKLLSRLLLLFIFLPALELILLLQFHRWTNFWVTVGLIVGTGLLGSYLAKREGVSAWQRLKDSFARGDLPGRELLDGVIILIAGALLVAPGLITDVVGVLGLLPPSRAVLRGALMKRFAARQKAGISAFGFGTFDGPFADFSAPQDDRGWQGQGRETPGYVTPNLREPPPPLP